MSAKSISYEKEEHRKQRLSRLAILKEIKAKLETLGIEQVRFDDKIKNALSSLIDANLFDGAGIDVIDKERQLFAIANKLIELSKLRKQGDSTSMSLVQRDLLGLYKDFLI